MAPLAEGADQRGTDGRIILDDEYVGHA